MIKKPRQAKTKAPPKKPRRKSAIKPVESNGAPRKIHPVIALIEEWLQDESGYDEEAWPALKKALDEERDRVGARRLFDE